MNADISLIDHIDNNNSVQIIITAKKQSAPILHSLSCVSGKLKSLHHNNYLERAVGLIAGLWKMM